MEKWLFIGGYFIQMTGSSLLLANIWRKRSVYGLSSDMQICFFLSTLSRIFWSSETRLIETYLAYAEIWASTAVAAFLCYSLWKYRHTTTKEAWWPLRCFTLTPICLIISFFFHPGSKFFSTQILVSFTMYMEAAALIPQLYLMRKMIEVEPLTSHYVALLIISRIIRIAFWIQLIIKGEHFLGLILADMFHTILAADYMCVWCRKLRTGGALIYKI